MALCTATKLQVPDHHRQVAHTTDDIRHRALVRLYERRLAVDSLIHALERYEREQKPRLANWPETSAAEKW
jgi:hypothetical protein